MASKKQKNYTPESLMTRTVCGMLLLALSVLMIVTLVMKPAGEVFRILNQVLYGLGGSFCPGIPILLGWWGILVLLSSRRRTRCRTLVLTAVMYTCVLCVVCLFTHCYDGNTMRSYDLMEYIRLTNRRDYLRNNPTEFLYFCRRIYTLCADTHASGGMLGCIVAWPLWMGLGQAGAIAVDILLILVLALILIRFDMRGILLKARSVFDKQQDSWEAAQQQQQQQRMEQQEQYRQEHEEHVARRRSRPAVQQAPLYDETFPGAEQQLARSYFDRQPAQSAAQQPVRQDNSMYERPAPAEPVYEPAPRQPAPAEPVYEPAPVPETDYQPIPRSVPVQEPVTETAEDDDLPPWEEPEQFAEEEETADYRAPENMHHSKAQEKVFMSGKPLGVPEVVGVENKGPDNTISTQYKMPANYEFPTMAYLQMPKRREQDFTYEDEQNTRRLLSTLNNFGIEGSVQHVTHGPAITRYELDLARDVNIKRLFAIEGNIAKDLASTAGVRIQAPIPGTTLVGIEVPNAEVASITLREVLESDEMRKATAPLTVALGKDIADKPIICNLAKMPHLLIAGATGSGKSVCINTIINSILYRCTPDQVRLILVDPKVVELQCYNGVPHLLIPVVSDPHKASGALAWAVNEMMERYAKLEAKGVRNIEGYNASVSKKEEKMPYIVIIIDELADLMMACKKEVEESICRIAQLARAAGIHMVVATQRPSVDVITGLIKANIPSRIAFAVTSNVDSRTILDAAGAEKLLGRGDMYYAPMGARVPVRVQGCFVSDDEVHNITDYFRRKFHPDYKQDVIDQLDKQEAIRKETAATVTGGDAASDIDPLLADAIEMVVRDGQASISMLQRKLSIGYARAGKLVDDMERRGIIGPGQGAKPREILVTMDELDDVVSSL